MNKPVLISIALLGVVACSGRKDPPPAPPAAAAAPSRDQRKVEIEGLHVTIRGDGLVDLEGADRWGRPLDATYESVLFFKRAVPALSLNVTAAQAGRLSRLADELSGGPH
jgi:hypothetical protein